MRHDPVSLPGAFTRRPIAHRALHDAGAGVIENSPTAIRRAIEAGYGIEIDVQLSADGVAMIFHDETLDRLTDRTGLVRGLSAEALGQVKLGASSDKIPTLAEGLAVIDGRVPLLIELKDQTGVLGPGPSALEEAVAGALAGYAGPVAVMSFNPHMVEAMARLAPDVPRGLTTCAFEPDVWAALLPEACDALREIGSFDRVGASFVSHDRADLRADPVARLKARGVPILCWTIKSPEAEVEARKVADGITFEGYRAPFDI